jgi:hypothetical protein
LDSSIEKKYFIFECPFKFTSSDAIRNVACEAIYITNDINNYRLICAYETYTDNNYIYALIVNENFDGIDAYEQTYKISQLKASGIRFYRINSFNVRFVLRKNIYDLNLIYENYAVSLKLTKGPSNLIAYSATRDLFDYNNNFIVSSEVYKKNFMGKKNFYYFTINKATTNNYYKIYEYSEAQVSKLLCYYDESNDLFIIVYQGKTNKKYIFL